MVLSAVLKPMTARSLNCGLTPGDGPIQRVYDPGRILYPLKRTGPQGKGEFHRISWNDALNTVAQEIIRVRDTYGPASHTPLSMGGDFGVIHGAHYLVDSV